jgi:phosphoglycolate phosphatase
MHIKLIIFDLDGTITDSLDDLTEATNAMLRHFDRGELNSREVRLLVGQGARRLVERAMPDASPEEIDEGVRLFVAYNEAHIADKTQLYPGVRETLAFLAKFWQLAVISNKNEALCRKLLDVLGVAGHFREIMGADSLFFRKPSPGPVLKLLADAGVTAAETVIVGDSSNDIIAGKGAGVVTIGCTYGYGEPDELAGADYRIDRFAEIIDLPLFNTSESEKN